MESNVCAKLAIVLTTLLAGTAGAAESGVRERTFVRALERFDAAQSPADYRAAADMLESILADGYCSGAVYYNLGNAYFRAGEFGRAILAYRKAVPYRPRDAYLAANLRQALAAAPGRLGEPPRPWWRHVLFWNAWLSYPTKVRGTAIVTGLSAVLGCLAVVLRRPQLRRGAVGLLVVASALGLDAALSRSEVLGTWRAVIVGETIARKGTGQSYEPAFDQPLRDGAEFEVLNETADWVLGRFPGVGDGWVKKEFVAR